MTPVPLAQQFGAACVRVLTAASEFLSQPADVAEAPQRDTR